MTKVILFDTDGMVVITEMFSVMYCKEFGIPYEKILPFFKNEFQPCIVGKADLKKQVKPYLKDWGWDKPVEEFLNYWFKAEHNIDKRVVKLISRLRRIGVMCCLATNQEKYRTQYLREQMGFNQVFDKIYSSAEIGYKKPQPGFFEYIIRDLKLPKDEIQFWDDTEENVQAANDVGLKGYRYQDYEDFKKVVEKLIRLTSAG